LSIDLQHQAELHGDGPSLHFIRRANEQGVSEPAVTADRLQELSYVFHLHGFQTQSATYDPNCFDMVPTTCARLKSTAIARHR